MKCIFCGAEIPDNAKFCGHCGSKTNVEVEIEPDQNQMVYPAYQQEPYHQEQYQQPEYPQYDYPQEGYPQAQSTSEKNNKGTALIVILLIVLAVLVGLMVFLFINKNNKASSEVLDLVTYDASKVPEVTTEVQEETAETASEEAETTEDDGPAIVDDKAIHEYEIVYKDVTWQQAYNQAIQKGGYLVRINTQDEFDAIVELLNEGENGKYRFYVGGKRESDNRNYRWINEDGEYLDGVINAPGNWYDSIWYDNEPSFEEDGMDIEENSLCLFKVSDNWWLNDTTDDLNGDYDDLFSGSIGYIIEYE